MVLPRALDRALGEALVEILKAYPADIINTYQFVRDEYVISDRMESIDTPQMYVTSNNLIRERLSRGGWMNGVALQVKLFTEAKPETDDTYSQPWLEDWLIAWDQIVDYIEDAAPLGVKASAIEIAERYDREYLSSRSRLLITADVLYRNIPGA